MTGTKLVFRDTGTLFERRMDDRRRQEGASSCHTCS